MSITKAYILSELNRRLDREESDIDKLIERALRDITKKVPALRSQYTLAITASGDSYNLLTLEPKIRSIIDITINGGVPIDKISYADYLEKKAGQTTSSRSEPIEYCYYNDILYLTPSPDNVYTGVIDYVSFELDADSIGLPDLWEECVVYGTCKKYEEDVGNAGEKQWKLYNGLYLNELEENNGLKDKKETLGRMTYNG